MVLFLQFTKQFSSSNPFKNEVQTQCENWESTSIDWGSSIVKLLSSLILGEEKETALRTLLLSLAFIDLNLSYQHT